MAINTNWAEYQVTFSANETTTASRLQFLLGAVTGTVWLDNVRLRQHGAAIYQREFDHGLVLLNGSRQSQTINVGPGFRRLTGPQAPRVEYISMTPITPSASAARGRFWRPTAANGKRSDRFTMIGEPAAAWRVTG